MSAQDKHGGNLEEDNSNSHDGEPTLAEARQFDSAKDGDGRVAGKEKIVAYVVSDERGRESGIVPDHVRRRGKSAEGLHGLTQTEQQHKSEEGPNAGTEEPAQEEKDSKSVDESGAENQERV